MSDLFEVKVPDIGDFSDVELIEVSVNTGDQIEKDQTMIVLESDKASMEIPAEIAGIIKEIKVKVGDKLSQGDLIAIVEVDDATNKSSVINPTEVSTKPDLETKFEEVATPSTPEHAETKTEAPVLTPTPESTEGKTVGNVHAAPSVRRFARELGVDLSQIKSGTGRKGRLLKEDVKNIVNQSLSSGVVYGLQGGKGIPPIPATGFAKFGEIDEKPLNKIRQLTGEFLTRNWLNLPMVTHHDAADVTEMEAFRKSLKKEAEQKGLKVTGLIFIMKALVSSLKQFPQFNSSISVDGKSLFYKKYFHIGIAVDTPNGLVVPVIHDVDKKSLYELAEDLNEMSKKARDGKLMPDDMQGGCMTISSLGGIGGKSFTPIVNAPEVAILGVTRSEMKPVWNGEEFVPRLMLPLDLTYDHRVIDGADGARFTRTLCELLSDIRRLLL